MKEFDPLDDGISSIVPLPITQSDLTVVNAARVSMHKLNTEIDMDRDPGLINYLAKHNHWTPFSHVQFMLNRHMPITDYLSWVNKTVDEQFSRSPGRFEGGQGGYDKDLDTIDFFERGSLYAFLKNGIVTPYMKETCPLSVKAFGMMDTPKDAHTMNDVSELLIQPSHDWWDFDGDPDDIPNMQVASFRIKMPIFVARQWFKHQIGFTRNEVSRRYVSEPPEYFIPEEWRLKADNVKQGSSNEIHEFTEELGMYVEDTINQCDNLYAELIGPEDVCPEQSRLVLPQAMYTEFVETGSWKAYKRLIDLRMDNHAQKEVREYAFGIKTFLDFITPYCGNSS